MSERGNSENDISEVKQVIQRFARAFAQVDVAGLRAVWDEQYPVPVYQPEETLAPMLTKDAVHGYFEHLPEVIRGVTDIQPIDFKVDVLGEVAHAFSRARAKLLFVRSSDTLDGEVRQTFILRKRDGAWRMIHYHESRLTPGLEELVS